MNYWPRSSALAMWRRFDAGEIGEDFARIAGLGLDTVRFFVRWDDFQPQPDRVDTAMLDRLEAVVTLAAGAGLRTVPVLCCGHLEGVNWLPGWSLDRNVRARVRTFADGAPSAHGVRDLYRGALLDAQLVLARAAGERLRGHPAVLAWDIGHAFSRVCEPSRAKASTGDHSPSPVAEYAMAEWSRRMTAALCETSSIPATAGTDGDDLTADRSVRLGSLSAPFAFASMQGSTVACAFARGRLDPEAIPFLASLAAGFSGRPVTVTGFGNPTCPPEKFSAFERFASLGEPPNLTISPDDTAFATYPCLAEDENAAWCTAVLERLHADGRLGAYWWCWTDPAPALHDGPPFDHEPFRRSLGIVRDDGSEKPVAAALAAFARERRSIVRPRDAPTIASNYYYRTLPVSTRTLYDAYLGTIAERRAAPTG